MSRIVTAAWIAAVLIVSSGAPPDPPAATIEERHTAAQQSRDAVSEPAERYWCPMHPEIRGRAGDRCPLCGMALVEIRAPDFRAFALDVELTPRALPAGRPSRLALRVRDPQSGAVVSRFEDVHERPLHLFVVSYDLEYFAHLHPRLESNGTFLIDVELPRPGAYQVVADFLPSGAVPQLVQRAIVTSGYRGRLFGTARLTPDLTAKTAEGTRISLTTPEAIAGREQLITFDLSDERTGAPVTDLQPFLGAAGHLLAINADLTVAFHSHPAVALTNAAGPTIVFQLLFPRPGEYRVWAQFQRGGRVLTVPFTIGVLPRT